VSQTLVQNSIGNLVAEFIRMTFGHRLGGEKHVLWKHGHRAPFDRFKGPLHQAGKPGEEFRHSVPSRRLSLASTSNPDGPPLRRPMPLVSVLPSITGLPDDRVTGKLARWAEIFVSA
jgi:hypothetical protein